MRFFWPLAIACIAILGAVQIKTALGESPSFDELMHLGAGFANLKAGDYRFNEEHPPLIKILCALPALAMGAKLVPSATASNEVHLGYDVMYLSGVDADALLYGGRAVAIAITLLFAFTLAFWTRRNLGPQAALIALALFCLDPNIIAHGRYITTDVSFAFFFFLSCITWAAYLNHGRTRDLLLAAAVFGLAQATKFSAPIVLPILVMLYAIRWWQFPKDFSVRRTIRASAILLAAWLIAIAIVYWPETVRFLEMQGPALATRIDRDSPIGNIMYWMAAGLHLPAHSYLVGFSEMAAHNHGGHLSYLLGKQSYVGWWYYFPVVFAVKSTVAALIASAVIIVAAITGFPKLARNATIILPPLVYFLASISSNINLGVRHILVIYPFLYIIAAVILIQLPWKRTAACVAIGLVALQAIECASIYPDYLAFFNVLAGGPDNGPHYLLDSNIDWGQDAIKLEDYLKKQGTDKVWIAYFGSADLHHYHIDWQPLPADPKDQQQLNGFAAVSVTFLYGLYLPQPQFAWLRTQTPIAKIGHSIYVYDLRK